MQKRTHEYLDKNSNFFEIDNIDQISDVTTNEDQSVTKTDLTSNEAKNKAKEYAETWTRKTKENIIKREAARPTSSQPPKDEESNFSKMFKDFLNEQAEGAKNFFGLESNNTTNLDTWNHVTLKVLYDNNIFGGQLNDEGIKSIIKEIKDQNKSDVDSAGKTFYKKRPTFVDIVIELVKKNKEIDDSKIEHVTELEMEDIKVK